MQTGTGTTIFGVRRGTAIGVAVAVLALFAAAVYWFGPQRLVTDRVADEALPGAIAVPNEAGDGAAAPAPDDVAVDLTTLAEGTFRSLAHETTGRVRLLEGADGATFLRIEDLDSFDGPDLRVYLTSADAGDDAAAFGDANLVADLGDLRANMGNLTYRIPADVALDEVRSVSIWCRRFSVGFGVAGLTG